MKKIIGLVLFLLLSGCTTDTNETQVKTYQVPEVQTSLATKVSDKISTMEEITNLEVVAYKNQIYVAAKPAHHERFQLDALKKKIKEKAEKTVPNKKVYVSVDRKIFMLLEELDTQIKEKSIPKENIEKKLKKVRTEMKSDT